MINHNSVIKKYNNIQKKYDKLDDELNKLQEDCTHPHLRYKNEGSSGNWDNTEHYWRDWYCPSCKKRWTTSQDYSTVKQLETNATNVSKDNVNIEYYDKFYGDWLTIVTIK